jgi:hypothetical protein
MIHLVKYSGGAGSYMCGKRVADREGTKDLYLLFTDTLTEDEDLYRFAIEGAFNIFGLYDRDLLDMASNVPRLEDNEEDRRKYLLDLSILTMKIIPNFIWLIDGRNIWEIFFKERYIGSSRRDPCSKKLKREIADRYIYKKYKPDEVIIYLGIDWTEDHRYIKARDKFLPYICKAPMTEDPLMDKAEVFEFIQKQGIRLPRLYDLGFSHNNCGGFCIKAGLGHFKNLLEKMPDRYAYHEKKEQEFYDFIQRDASVGFLRKSIQGERVYISMKQLREMTLSEDEARDVGGCGCYVDNI